MSFNYKYKTSKNGVWGIHFYVQSRVDPQFKHESLQDFSVSRCTRDLINQKFQSNLGLSCFCCGRDRILGSLEKGEKVQQTRQLLGYEPTAFKLCVFIKKATLTRKSMSSIMTIPIQILQLHYIHFSFLLSLDRHKKIKKRPPGLVRLKRLNIFFQL